MGLNVTVSGPNGPQFARREEARCYRVSKRSPRRTQMEIAVFMASPTGRLARIVAGVVLIVLGFMVGGAVRVDIRDHRPRPYRGGRWKRLLACADSRCPVQGSGRQALASRPAGNPGPASLPFGHFDHVSRHSPEDEVVERHQRIPVQQPPNTGRMEPCVHAQHRLRFASRLDRELEDGRAGTFISAMSVSRLPGSMPTTRQKSSVSPSRRSVGWRRPRRSPTPPISRSNPPRSTQREFA